MPKGEHSQTLMTDNRAKVTAHFAQKKNPSRKSQYTEGHSTVHEIPVAKKAFHHRTIHIRYFTIPEHPLYFSFNGSSSDTAILFTIIVKIMTIIMIYIQLLSPTVSQAGRLTPNAHHRLIITFLNENDDSQELAQKNSNCYHYQQDYSCCSQLINTIYPF